MNSRIDLLGTINTVHIMASHVMAAHQVKEQLDINKQQRAVIWCYNHNALYKI
ncbi:hypothetical protein DSUL_60002 [Desulfovibrionales bacterium]